jgi:DNA-binding response OmpR family regulator
VPHRPKVLVVEDDAALRKVLELRLVLEGFDVALAEDGQAGLEALPVVQPDVVITDLMMPRVDGGGFCAGARTTPGFEGVPIILLTAHQRDAYVDDVLELGGIVFMAKPFDAPALADTLRDLVANGWPLAERQLQAS